VQVFSDHINVFYEIVKQYCAYSQRTLFCSKDFHLLFYCCEFKFKKSV